MRYGLICSLNWVDLGYWCLLKGSHPSQKITRAWPFRENDYKKKERRNPGRKTRSVGGEGVLAKWGGNDPTKFQLVRQTIWVK